MRRNAGFWVLLGVALLIGAWTSADQHRRIGQPIPGFAVLEDLLIGVGGLERGGLRPFDLVRVMDGRVLTSGAEIQSEVTRHPPGTRFRYILYREGRLVEAEVASRLSTWRDYGAFLLGGLLPGLLLLGLGALVFVLKPGAERSWLFLTFCMIAYLVTLLQFDAHTTYRFSGLFLTAWAFWPAVFIHLALTFPQRRRIVRRFPRVVWLPYFLSAAVAILLLARFHPQHEVRLAVVASVGAAYWSLALLLLVLALARTMTTGSTPLMRQRARALFAAFTLSYLAPVLGTAVEAMFRVPVPYLATVWQLTSVFPLVMAYAMARYDVFDIRAALRAGTVYSVVTGLVILGYTGAIALTDLTFGRLGVGRSPIVAATVIAMAVVLLLNPVYVRVQRLVDRLFFRDRIDLQRSLERVVEEMTTLLDLGRIVGLLTRTVEQVLHPTRQALLLVEESTGDFRAAGEDAESEPRLLSGSSLPIALGRVRDAVSLERLEEDPRLRDLREGGTAQMTALGADLVVPVVIRDRVTGCLVLGGKRAETAYSSEDLRLLRLLVNQSALALEHAKSYTALERANAELKVALQRVEILESIRSNLAKFVPRTVQDLIERAPEAPALDKRETDVTVLFVDIAGYTRLSERVDPARVNELVERYFGAFLDEILRRGGDVNETAGDGLMAIFQDPDPGRHARAAVKTALAIVRRTEAINRDGAGAEPIQVHVGVNSGVATVGATKIEGRTGIRWTYTASGPVTNVAARLAALDAADGIVVGPETRRRLGDEFAFEALGEQRLRNVAHPVAVFRLAAPAPSPTPAPAPVGP